MQDIAQLLDLSQFEIHTSFTLAPKAETATQPEQTVDACAVPMPSNAAGCGSADIPGPPPPAPTALAELPMPARNEMCLSWDSAHRWLKTAQNSHKKFKVVEVYDESQWVDIHNPDIHFTFRAQYGKGTYLDVQTKLSETDFVLGEELKDKDQKPAARKGREGYVHLSKQECEEVD